MRQGGRWQETDREGASSSDARTEAAVRRTVMAADRTLMSWIRTALSMITFGFSIYAVLRGFQDTGIDLPRPQTPRNVGLALTGLGTFAMTLGTLQYLAALRDLARIRRVSPWRATLFVAGAMSGLGLFLFVGIFVNVL